MRTPNRPLLGVLIAASIEWTCVIVSDSARAAPLTAEAALTEVGTDNFAGLRPSPDGRAVAFDVSRSTESLEFEYSNQIFTQTGYPMWSSLSIYRGRILDLDTGKVTVLPDQKGASWGGSWSPDGRSYAFYSDSSGAASVWIWDRRSGHTRQLSDAVVRMFRNTDAPVWTPDGKRVLFKALPEGKTLNDMQRFNAEYVAAFEKSRAPSAAVRVHVYRSPAEQEVGKSAGNDAFINYRYLSDVVSVDVESGNLTRIARSVHPLRFSLSPDGRWLGLLNLEGVFPNTQRGKFSLSVYSLDTHVEKIIDASVSPGDPAMFSWSPQSDRIAYATHEGATLNDWVAYAVNVRDGQRVRLAAPKGQVFSTLGWGAPLWDRSGNRIYLLDMSFAGERLGASPRLWSIGADGHDARQIGVIPGRSILDIVTTPDRNSYWPLDDGASMVVRTTATDTRKDGLYRIDLRTGAAQQIVEVDARIERPLSAPAGDSRHVAFFQTDVGRAPEVHVLDLQTRAVRQVTRLHPELLEVAMGKSQLIEWLSPTGERLRGAVLLPPDARAGKPLPLVVWIYGGSRGSESLNDFGFGWGSTFNMQMLATRGYAVLFPDAPMHDGTPVQDVADAVLSGVNRVVEMGIADPDRLAVMGQSFGGYNTMSLLTQSTRFKAAVISGSATINTFEGYSRFENGVDAGTGYYEQGQGALRSTPWEKPLRYLENSPFFFLDRVTTPVMIIRGTRDSISQMSGSIFNSLRRLGKTAEFLEYENDGHVVQQPTHVVDAWNRRIAWLDRFLQPPANPQ